MLQSHAFPDEVLDMKRLVFPAALFLIVLSPSARAAEPTDWFHQAQWGVMTHYLGAPPSSKGGAELTAEMWNEQVDAFDVAGLVDQLASTGAKYLLFTLGQNSGHYCSPNDTYDRIVGISPSKCSRRDLIADLAKALAARNIRLMVYLPSGAPAADPVARKALGWRWGAKGGWQLPGEPVGGRLAEFQRNWEAVIREWSLRWGKSVSGWWIDGCYFADQMYRFDDEPNFASFAKALKAGNPEAIVAFNPGVKVPVVCHTKYDDYTAGEVNLPQLAKAVEACPGRWLECEGRKVQFQILTYLGKTWCQGDQPQQPDEKIVALTRQLAEKGGVVTFDVPIQKGGLIPQPFVGQLRAIGRAMTRPTKPSEAR
jgi:alpha-L-fucosidase